MIKNKDQIFELIRNTEIQKETINKNAFKLFEKAIRDSVEENSQNLDKIHLAYSGGVDSCLMLALLTNLGKKVVAYTLGSNEKHPDVIYSKMFAQKLGIEHKIYLVEKIPKKDIITCDKLTEHLESKNDINTFELFKYANKQTNVIFTCDGIDEIVGGYWMHRWPNGTDNAILRGLRASDNMKMKDYIKEPLSSNRISALRDYWCRLIPEHLMPLDIISSYFNVTVILPYLDKHIIKAASSMDINDKVDTYESKKPIRLLAKKYSIPTEIINRPKKGFCDALRKIYE